MEYKYENVNTMERNELEEVLKKLELACERIAKNQLSEAEVIGYMKTAIKHVKKYEELPDNYFWGFDNPQNMPADVRVAYVYNPTYVTVAFMISAYMKMPEKLETIDGFHEIFAGGLNASTNRGFRGHYFDEMSDFRENMKLFLNADADLFVEKYPNISPKFTKQFAAATAYVRDMAEMHILNNSEEMVNYRKLNEYSYRVGEKDVWSKCWINSEIDAGIRDIIVRLNRKGYYTTMCCEGHPERSQGARETFVQIGFREKYNWAIELPFYGNEKGITCKCHENAIYWATRKSKVLAKKESDKQEILKAISEWVDKLPVKEEK